MANEISFSNQLSVSQGSVVTTQFTQGTATQTTFGIYPLRQTIPTSDTVIALTGPAAARWVQIKNVDPTNYVSIGSTVSGAIAKIARLLPGESMSFPMEPSTVLRAIAHTASVAIEYTLLET